MNESIMLALVTITMMLIFLSPTLYRMIKEMIKDNKVMKKLDLKIIQKKKDRDFISTYDCNSRFLGELVNGMACLKMSEEQKVWHDELVEYLNDNAKEYSLAHERLSSGYYDIKFEEYF